MLLPLAYLDISRGRREGRSAPAETYIEPPRFLISSVFLSPVRLSFTFIPHTYSHHLSHHPDFIWPTACLPIDLVLHPDLDLISDNLVLPPWVLCNRTSLISPTSVCLVREPGITPVGRSPDLSTFRAQVLFKASGSLKGTPRSVVHLPLY